MEILVHNALHVLEHSFVETIYLVPFLFLAYLAMEWLEHKTGERTQKAIARAGAAGPVVGSVLVGFLRWQQRFMRDALSR